jgi:hypothetical protein
MAAGEGTQHVARRFGLSPSRVSQMRREYSRDWRQFCDDEASIGGLSGGKLICQSMLSLNVGDSRWFKERAGRRVLSPNA